MKAQRGLAVVNVLIAATALTLLGVLFTAQAMSWAASSAERVRVIQAISAVGQGAMADYHDKVARSGCLIVATSSVNNLVSSGYLDATIINVPGWRFSVARESTTGGSMRPQRFVVTASALTQTARKLTLPPGSYSRHDGSDWIAIVPIQQRFSDWQNFDAARACNIH